MREPPRGSAEAWDIARSVRYVGGAAVPVPDVGAPGAGGFVTGVVLPGVGGSVVVGGAVVPVPVPRLVGRVVPVPVPRLPDWPLVPFWPVVPVVPLGVPGVVGVVVPDGVVVGGVVGGVGWLGA